MAVRPQMRQRVEQGLTCFDALVINELVQLSGHAEVVHEQRIPVEVLEQAKLALLYRQLAFVFEVQVRVYQSLPRVLPARFRNQTDVETLGLVVPEEARLDVGPVHDFELALRPLERSVLQIIHALRMHYLDVVFLRLVLRLLEKRVFVHHLRWDNHRGRISELLLLERALSVLAEHLVCSGLC